MRCFLGCFTKPNNKRLNAPSPTHATAESLPLLSSSAEIPITEPLGTKLEEPLSCNGETKMTSSNCSEKNSPFLSIVARNNEEKRGEEPPNESKSAESNLISSKLNPRYSKQESDDLDLKDVGDRLLVEEESSESLFSISIDSRKYTYGAEVGEKEVSSPPTQSAVLAPIDNLARLKTAKATATLTLQTQDKENINTNPNTATEVSSFQVLSKTVKHGHKRHLGEEIAVDASLSSWLNEAETTPMSKGSTDSVGPLNTPILGTIGSFWHHTGRSVDSDSSSSIKPVKKCAKDDEASSDSTPFKASLDRAMCEIVNQN